MLHFFFLICVSILESCYLCGYTLPAVSGSTPVLVHLKHLSKHRNCSNVKFQCCYADCSKIYSSYAALYTHCKRKHFLYQTFTSEHDHVAMSSVVNTSNLKCTVPRFGKRYALYSDFVKHLKSHLRSEVEVKCPISACSCTYTKVSSFSSHLSCVHKHKAPSVTTSQTLHNTSELFLSDAADALSESGNEYTSKDTLTTGTIQIFNDVEKSGGNDNLVAPFVMFLLKLESKLLVSQNAIQAIVNEVKMLSESADEYLKSELMKSLEMPEIQLSKFHRIMDNASLSASLLKHHNIFGTAYCRKQYYQKNFSYVAPVEVYLGENSSGKCSLHYIPIIGLLQMFLTNCTETLSYSSSSNAPDMLCDFWDGNLYKYLSGQDSINIFLYQDSFEMVNPLGSTRKKHKLLAVYCVIGNLPPSTRMSLDNILLIMLVRESYLKNFGQSVVFRRLIVDLNKLCVDGISCNDGIFKVKVLSILGDNLGAHCIGGFVENFSSKHFCRFCLIDKCQFQQHPYVIGETRTVEKYDSSVKMIEHDPSLNQHIGVKFDSQFNQLQNFRVCLPALPPCIGHDLFEGIVPYDMALYIKQFVRLG